MIVDEAKAHQAHKKKKQKGVKMLAFLNEPGLLLPSQIMLNDGGSEPFLKVSSKIYLEGSV